MKPKLTEVPVTRPPSWLNVPTDYHVRIRNMRSRLRLTQTEFAKGIGAASKAVIYQWESKKRCPSPVFWERIEQLAALR